MTTIIVLDTFYLAFPNDPFKMKILVYGVYAVELLQTILISKMMLKQFAIGFGSFAVLNDMGLLWFVVPILSSIGIFSFIFLLTFTYL